MNIPVVCTSCGHSFAVGVDHAGAGVMCPHCRAICAVPLSAAAPEKSQEDGWITAKAPRHVPSPTAFTDDVNSLPYEVAPAATDMPTAEGLKAKEGVGDEAAQLYDTESETDDDDEKLPPSIALPTADPLKRQWEATATLGPRLGVFAVYELVLFLFGLMLFLEGESTLTELIVTGGIFSALAAYVLGTYERLNLSRNFQGRVVLSKTWRCCFISLGAKRIALRGFETVATSANQEKVLFDWLMLVWLLSLALVPGILWFFFVFSKPTYQVALAKAHGQASVILYQGTDEERMNDIARTVSEVCRYRWRRTY